MSGIPPLHAWWARRPPTAGAAARYDVRRWATAFPMGMTAAAMLSATAMLSAAAVLSVAAAVGVPWLKWPGRVLVWVAVAAWPAVAAGAVAVTRDALRKAS
ncbi:hypothetical protein ACGFZQ_06605 [Streptomyces sp. NPDC048254]|uniref:hypothetical protein n=1 Tax=Streptomyces sp. NPDC048254 TaxID=3365525 RepID=UPI0037106470